MKEQRFLERRGDALAIVTLLIPECATDVLSLYDMEQMFSNVNINDLMQQISEATAECDQETK